MNSRLRAFPRSLWQLLPLAIVGLWGVTASGELIPAARLTDLTPGVRTGVIGGIPTDRTNRIDVTQAPYNADNTGATDTRPTLQAAINAAATGDVVYLPAGTYRIDGTLTLGTNFSGKTLRGAGPGSTIIDQRTSSGLKIGSESGFSGPLNSVYAPGPPILVTAGLIKGSTTVTVDHMDFLQGSGAPGFTVGQMILFNVQNDETVPVVSVYNYDVFTNQAPTNQMVRVVAKNESAKTVTFYPPLFDAYGGGSLQVRVLHAVYQATGIGLEDLTVDATNYTAGGGAFNCVQINSSFGSWVKNCTIKKAKNYNLYLQDSLNCEVRHSTLSGSQIAGTNGSGLLFNRNSSCLIEDNIILDSWPLVEVNMGASGNVFAYNYSSDGMWDTNHAPHNQFNLYEGNAAGYQMSDGYFGGEANLTIFRNYWHGAYGVNLRRWTRNASVVGNMLPSAVGDDGYPNMGNTGFDGTAQLSAGDPWRDWHMKGTLTGRADNGTGEITLDSGFVLGGDAFHVVRLVWGAGKDQSRFALVPSVTGRVAQIANYSGGTTLPTSGTTIYIGAGAFYSGVGATSSYQEKDLDVAVTTIKKGNRYAGTNNFDSLGGDALPNSLFRTSRPSWFNDLAWPPYDPVTPRTPSVEHIPAGYRYVHGVDPGGGVGDTSPPTIPANLFAAASGSTRIDLSWSVSADNVAVTGYRVERSQGAGSTIYIPVGSPTGVNYSDTGLAATTVYNYRVRAVDASGNLSGYSSVGTVATVSRSADTTAPSIPQNLTAVANGATLINLNWSASTDNVGVIGYRMERSQGVGSTTFAEVSPPTGSSNSDSGLTPGTIYNYRVRAVDAAGNFSGYSSVATATTANLPDMTAPTVPSNVATVSGPTQMDVSWIASTDNVGVTGYRIERSQGAGSATYAQIGTPTAGDYSDAGLATATIYNYRIRAVDAAGNLSDYSTVATATTSNLPDTIAPTAPANVNAVSNGPGRINVNWVASTDNLGVTGYQVERSHGVGSAIYAQIGTTAGVSYGDTGLMAATVYNYRVRAVDASGNLSGYSSMTTATTAATASSNGLVAAYGFDESSGNSVTDGSGNDNTGTINGASRTLLGRYGRALRFNGIDNTVLVNSSLSLNLSPAMTLEAWVFPAASENQWGAILHKEADAWYLHSCNPNGDRPPAGGANFNGGEQYVAGPTALSLNGWTHLATTYDGTTLRLYVNGAEVATRPTTGTIEVNSNPLRIGGNAYAGQFFAGRIDEIRIYNRALTPSEIQADMNVPVGAPNPPSGLRIGP